MTAPDIVRGLTVRLAQLASRDYHDRYLANGTKDAYRLPEEIIDTVGNEIDRARRPENAVRLSSAQRDALDRMDDVISAKVDTALGEGLSREAFSEHVMRGESWATLRRTASDTLRTFDLPNAHALTADEVEAL